MSEGNLVPDKNYNQQLQRWLKVPGVEVTPCALILPKDLDFDSWAALGPKLGKLRRFCTWALGDWLSHGEVIYGQSYSQACDTTGLQPDYLMVLKHVASRIEPDRRRPSLSFAHHKAVASLGPLEQDKLLGAAERNQWTRDEMAAAVKEFKRFPLAGSAEEVSISRPDEEVEAEIQRDRDEMLSMPVPTGYKAFKNKLDSVLPTLGEMFVELRDLYQHLPAKLRDGGDREKDLISYIASIQSAAFISVKGIESVYRWAAKHREDDIHDEQAEK